MSLTPTALRMLETLPAYYHGEPLVERILQSRANEVDRFDALLDQLAEDLIPSTTSDDHGVTGMWEQTLRLPPNPDGATIEQRRAKIVAVLTSIDSTSAADTLAAIEVAAGVEVTVWRDIPAPLHDTLTVDPSIGDDEVGRIRAFAERLWPAHRSLSVATTWTIGILEAVYADRTIGDLEADFATIEDVENHLP